MNKIRVSIGRRGQASIEVRDGNSVKVYSPEEYQEVLRAENQPKAETPAAPVAPAVPAPEIPKIPAKGKSEKLGVTESKAKPKKRGRKKKAV